MHKKVDNLPGYIKDMKTGAILNTNVNELKAKKEQLKKALQEKEEIEKLKTDVAEIKNLLHQLVNK